MARFRISAFSWALELLRADTKGLSTLDMENSHFDAVILTA